MIEPIDLEVGCRPAAVAPERTRDEKVLYLAVGGGRVENRDDVREPRDLLPDQEQAGKHPSRPEPEVLCKPVFRGLA